MWSSNTYSRCLLSRRSQLLALNDCSSYTVVGLLHAATAALMAPRRFANGFFLKQEIVSSSRRKRRHAMRLVALTAGYTTDC